MMFVSEEWAVLAAMLEYYTTTAFEILRLAMMGSLQSMALR